MLSLRSCSSLPLQWQKLHIFNSLPSLYPSPPHSFPLKIPPFFTKSNQNRRIIKPIKAGPHLPVQQVDDYDAHFEDDAHFDDESQYEDDVKEKEGEVIEEEGDDFDAKPRFTGREEGKDYDKDPEFADILGSYLDEPGKAQKKLEDRVRKKRNRILQTKTGSAKPMKVIFNKFDFSNSYIWFEFYNAPLSKDISLICDTIRSWHIIGRLGGCNSMNMQLSQSPLDKRPSYDAIQGANVTPTTFYNIGDFEVQDNLARIWVDIGTSEPLLLDTLINALTQISSDYVGIEKVVFGGLKLEDWKENCTSEDAGCSVHKI
ncbi:dna-directed rna polymerase i subunit rpa2 [Cinnamomum micranthum f. kanehirae]|uniref:Dna-directed rna polymerase i subunit rpa2 n=1 Tax=Cinnamomum micranthum f. kanehirae TaxID=337451 RepID=A0A443N224_9MAGN|nr:dna-directed rna polymerase i subunit rpa2 [Cinnamomum micranthum f. kanehirae]